MSILVGPVTLSATGGTISSITGYKVHTFSTPGTSTFIPSQNGTIEVLVVGGGGGSGYIGGGGGAGGAGGGAVKYNKFVNVTSGISYPITVGAVGVAGTIGGISSCTFNNATILAYGGGAGGANANGAAANGISSPNASGGGGGSNGLPAGTGGIGAGITGLGFPGGDYSGGGGGASSSGVGGFSPGGIGVSYSITGTSQYYGGGGSATGPGAGFGSPNGGLTPTSYGTGGTPGAVIIRYPV